jgi:hypothetical protein
MLMVGTYERLHTPRAVVVVLQLPGDGDVPRATNAQPPV